MRYKLCILPDIVDELISRSLKCNFARPTTTDEPQRAHKLTNSNSTTSNNILASVNVDKAT